MKKWHLLLGAVAVVGGLYLLNQKLSQKPTQYIPGGPAATVQTGDAAPRKEFAVGFLPVT